MRVRLLDTATATVRALGIIQTTLPAEERNTPMRQRLATALTLLAVLAFAVPGCAKSGTEQPEVVAPETSSVEPTTTPGSGPVDLDAIALELREIAAGLTQPLLVTSAGDGSGRLYVVEKTGRVKVLVPGASQEYREAGAPFLDLSDVVSTNSEQGLLGLAFSPSYSSTGRFYVNYTDRTGATVVSRFRVSDADSDLADPGSEEVLLRIDQPYANHNGGHVVFGPDKMLWIGMGDGGSGGDPEGNGQNPNTLLGKMLRIDVGESGRPAGGEPYGIPETNPFANPSTEEAGLPEIWAIGLRNPWRFSFDVVTGDLWIGDVGQNEWEEIDFIAGADVDAPPPGGFNFGWNAFEGTHPFRGGDEIYGPTGSLAPPVIEYGHAAGNSVTGGVVYRGKDHPGLQGVYLYGDFGSGRIWGVVRDAATGSIENKELLKSSIQVVSFGTDPSGEVFVVDFGGRVYRVVDVGRDG